LLDDPHLDLRQAVHHQLALERAGDQARRLADLVDEQPGRAVGLHERGDTRALRGVQFAQGVRGQ
jgi:hypothetical protein